MSKKSMLSAGDLQDLSAAIELVKANNCQGSVKLVFDGSEIPSIQTHLPRKSDKPSAPISDDIARWPRFILQPVKRD